MFFALADADVGPPLIVEGHELHPEPCPLEGALELLDRELGAEPDALSVRGPLRRERTLRGDLDGGGQALGRDDPRLGADRHRQQEDDPSPAAASAARPDDQSPDSRNVVE